MICDVVSPACVIRACCTQQCDEVTNYIADHLDRLKEQEIYHELYRNHRCPVCHGKSVLFTTMSSPGQDSIDFNLVCNSCNSLFYYQFFHNPKMMRGKVRFKGKRITDMPRSAWEACMIPDLIKRYNIEVD